MFTQLFQSARNSASPGNTPEAKRLSARIETQIGLVERALKTLQSLHTDVEALRINGGDFFAGTGSCEFGHEKVDVTFEWQNLAILSDTVGDLLTDIKAETSLSVWFVLYGSNNQIFRCEAEDREHAIEQCRDAHPSEPARVAVPGNESGSLILQYFLEDPVTCPKCGCRTEFAELSAGWQAHACMRCSHTFLAVPEDEAVSS